MKQIHIYAINRGTTEPQSVAMPRRARITGIHIPPQGVTIHIYAEVEHDSDTNAFDTGKHQRSFVKRTHDDVVPPEGALVGFDKGVHVYEVKSP